MSDTTPHARAGAKPFLVEITFAVDDLPSSSRERILIDERQRGRQLLREGRIVRIWRLPGTSSSVSVWVASSPAELDGMLRSLPIAPWSRFEVRELEEHPLEREAASS